MIFTQAMQVLCREFYFTKTETMLLLIRDNMIYINNAKIYCAIGSRENLGRPTTTPRENKMELMENREK